MKCRMASSDESCHRAAEDWRRVDEMYATFTRWAEARWSWPHRWRRPCLGSGKGSWLTIFLYSDNYVFCWSFLWLQVAHFTTPVCFDDLDPLHASLNGILPPDIRIREASSVQPEFHARYSACRKTYHYKAHVSPVLDPFQHNYSYHIRNHINVAAMQEAASYFVGVHNFSAFANHSTDSASRDLLRELLRFTVSSTVSKLSVQYFSALAGLVPSSGCWYHADILRSVPDVCRERRCCLK